jgi:hypothetical protein
MGQQLFTPYKAEIYTNSPTTLVMPPATVNVGGQQFTSALSLSLSVATTGIGGLDAGPVAINSFYYVYGVLLGTTPGLVASLSPPSVGPAGFLVYGRVGNFITDGSGNILSAWSRVRSAFIIAASGNYNVPYGLDYFTVRAVGGGGGGGGSTASGGGGAGGYLEAKFRGIPGGTAIPMTIGGGGGAPGGAGGDTVLGGPINVTCGGGGGGASVGGAPASAHGGFGGGVSGSITADMITVVGQAGGTGFGTGGVGYMGYGGSSALWGGGGENGSYPSNDVGPGVNYGSGGGGGYSAGAAGFQGAVVIEEFYL